MPASTEATRRARAPRDWLHRTRYRWRRALGWEGYWGYQRARWGLVGLGIAAAGVYAIAVLGYWVAGLFLLTVGAGWCYLVFRREP